MNVKTFLFIIFIVMTSSFTVISVYGETSINRPHLNLNKESVEKILSVYNFNALAKIDNGELPRFTLAIAADIQDVEGSQINIGEIMGSSISSSGRLTIIERSKLKHVLEEQKLALTGLVDENSGIQIGKLLGADYTMIGNVISLSKQKNDRVLYDTMDINASVQVKVVEINTGEVVINMTAEGNSSAKLITDSDGNLVSGAVNYDILYAEAVKKAVQGIVPDFIRKFPLTGFILKKGAGDDFLCDLGLKNSVNENDIVAIISKGNVNIHPVTKRLISVDYLFKGYGKLYQVKDSSSMVKIIYFEPGMKLENSDLAVYIDN